MLEWLVALLWFSLVVLLFPRADRRRTRPQQSETIDNYVVVEVMRRRAQREAKRDAKVVERAGTK